MEERGKATEARAAIAELAKRIAALEETVNGAVYRLYRRRARQLPGGVSGWTSQGPLTLPDAMFLSWSG